MNICLFGSGSRKTPEIYTNEAYKIGMKLAEKNHVLIFGGGKTGIMGACAKGMHEKNGEIIGIAPKWIGNFEPLYENCSEFIYVKSMNDRKQEFLNNSDAFIIAPGGIGTLDEFFEILTLKKLKQHNKNIIIFNFNHFFDKMLEMLDTLDNEGFLYKQETLFKVATTTDELFDHLDY